MFSEARSVSAGHSGHAHCDWNRCQDCSSTLTRPRQRTVTKPCSDEGGGFQARFRYWKKHFRVEHAKRVLTAASSLVSRRLYPLSLEPLSPTLANRSTSLSHANWRCSHCNILPGLCCATAGFLSSLSISTGLQIFLPQHCTGTLLSPILLICTWNCLPIRCPQ
jgi:hypothetical protein